MFHWDLMANKNIRAINGLSLHLYLSNIWFRPFRPFRPSAFIPILLISLSWIVAVLRGDVNVSGTVFFDQASETSPTTISYNIKGNDPDAERGIHVHQFGDNTNGCTSAGPHCKQLSSPAYATLQALNCRPKMFFKLI